MSASDRLNLYLQVLDNKDLSKLSQEKILEMRKRLNPYGRIIAGSDNYLNFSITQLSHEYWKKLIITSFVGYLNRMCDEWKVPTNVPVVSVYDYIADKTKADTPEKIATSNNASAIYDYEFNRKWMEKRVIVKEFLEEMFQFNPDEHVRSSYKPNYKDSTRPVLDTMAARLAINQCVKKDKVLAADKALHDDINGIKTKKVKKVIIGKDGKKKTVIREVPIDQSAPTPAAATDPTPLDKDKPLDSSCLSTVTNMIPPADIFGRFKMYMTENFEHLREAVLALYCEKPDLEFSLFVKSRKSSHSFHYSFYP